uniref:Retrovirus-related Pol polyprotein from transposon TNT 1-94 n=1 Tax=Tanacetum cinerariifolium TaxID=118510 RepID=A0A6L2LAI3_TANCI|nr:retrovirus-related Pol polyprotein from transposon TNT 1-94 [Tanacetum cinerariifolium]
MVNVIPPDHVDEVPVIEPNQHDDVPVVPEPLLVDEDEDPEQDEFKEEEDPQEEEDDMEIDIKEDENERELTCPYEEVDPFNPSLLASESEPNDEIEVKNLIEHEDKTVPASVHEVGMAVMEKLVEKLGNTEDKVECKKLKKELKEVRFSNTFLRMKNERVKRDLYLTRVQAHEFYQEMICRGFVFEERPNEAINFSIKDEKSPVFEWQGSPPDLQANVKNDTSGSGLARGQDVVPAVRECTFVGFMKYNPALFHGVEGAVELRRWFNKTESVFEISECAEGKKVKFAAATQEGLALTWWKTKVATIGLEIVNQMPWTEMKQLMTSEFCPIEEVERMEHELWNLKVMEHDVDAYIRGLTDNIKGEVTSSKPVDLNEAVRVAHKLMKQKSQARDARILEGKKQSERAFKVETVVCTIKCGKVGHKARYCKEKSVVTMANAQPIWTWSFVDTRLCPMVDINSIKIGASYEVELADGRVASTNNVLKGCTLNLVNDIFKIDMMPIEHGTFDVIIGMDWLVKHDAVIICGEKVVRIPSRNEMLIVIVTKNKSKEKGMEDVHVIYDFPEVFPKELPRLLSPRQVEFRIDLVPGATPVARAPYRLAPSEMKEFSVQLQELLEKGFIHPSSSVYSKIDMRSGYHQLCIKDEDISITAFRIQYVHFEFQEEEEHEKHLKIILELLKKERLYTKFSKCNFRPDSVSFLGHVIDRSGVYVDPAKIKAIKSWAAPTTPMEVRVGPVACTLELPEELKGIHSTFHVSNLRKCLEEDDVVILIDESQLDDKLHMIEEPVEVIDREVKRLKQSRIPIVKVRWNLQREPKNVKEAIQDESWTMAMQEELNQFKTNDIWSLVSLPRNQTIIGYNQQEGIDIDETYAPVARLESIRILLAYDCVHNFKIYQMDAKCAFLNGFINEKVYVAQPPGFVDSEKPNDVFKLKKALYCLKQAPKAWYDILKAFLIDHEYTMELVDDTLFTKKRNSHIIIVSIYVDDIIFGSTYQELCNEFSKIMHDEFEMSMMGELNFFLGLQIKQLDDGIFFNQSKYVKEMLKNSVLKTPNQSKLLCHPKPSLLVMKTKNPSTTLNPMA